MSQFSVGMRWGTDRVDKEDAELRVYSFDTLAELNAFLLGVGEAIDYIECEQVDPPFSDEGGTN